MKKLKQQCRNLVICAGGIENLSLLLIAVVYGMMFIPAIIIQDDLKFVSSVGSVKSILKLVVSQHYTWSSRQIINFVWYLVLRYGKAAWALYMAVSAYVLMKGLKMLSNAKSGLINWLCVTLLMIFPGAFFVSAGWIATTTSYFGPQAFGVMAVVPVKKCLNDEKLTVPEWLFYAACLVYAANAEQMCVVLLGVYLTAAVYFLIVKKRKPFIWLQLLLTVVSFVFMMTCPGNWVRKDQEIKRYFPTYGMLDLFDKADIGISTTLHWMFIEGGMVMILVCLILAFLVWKHYRDPLYRCIAVLPAALTILLGPLKNVLAAVFPYASYVSGDINYYGAFTVAANGAGVGRVQFILFLFLALCLLIEIVLLNDSLSGLLADVVLAVFGFGSRMMMGFSPTVYASNVRTYSTLVVCLFMLVVHVVSRNLAFITPEEEKKGKYAMSVLILIGLADLACLVATYGHS